MRPADTTDATPIALVDDDPLYGEVIAHDLVDRGFAVHKFRDGRTFLDAVQQGLAVRVVLLDWTLPAMSGLEVLRTLRQRQVSIPVVFLTGRCRVEFDFFYAPGNCRTFTRVAVTVYRRPGVRRLYLANSRSIASSCSTSPPSS